MDKDRSLRNFGWRQRFSIRRLGIVSGSIAGFGAATLLAAVTVDPANLLAPPALGEDLSKEAARVATPTGFADMVARVKPAVISVRVKSAIATTDLPFPPGPPLDRFFRRFDVPEGATPNQPGRRRFITGQGSGFFISSDGYAVTNYHVVGQADSVEVATDDGKTYTAKVVGRDQRTDLALIKIDGRDDFPHVSFAEKPPRIGEWVLAVGNPFGLSSTVTAGIISARGRDIGAGPYDDFIQIDAPVNSGNSGGPTFDVNGNVVGVNAAILSPSGGNIGIAFAIPAETVKMVVAELREKGEVTRGWLGVHVQRVTPNIADNLGLENAEGALVAEPQPGSPALEAGLQPGDVIVRIDGMAVKNARDLARKIAAMDPGSTVTLVVVRKGSERTLTATLAEMSKQRKAHADSQDRGGDKADDPRMGLSVAPARSVAGAGDQGVVVISVDPNGIAAGHGFRIGDVILEIGGQAVSTADEVRQALSGAHAGGKDSVLMRVKSGEVTKFMAVPLAES